MSDTIDVPLQDEDAHQRWTYIALVLGYNELAKKGTELGHKVYFRLCRDMAEAELLKAGGKPVFEKPAFCLEIETQDPMPRMGFRDTDIELMRQEVLRYDAASDKNCITTPDGGCVGVGCMHDAQPAVGED